VQVLLQIAALVNLLVLLGGTFLFRSGLFGMLYGQFRLVLLVHPLYICLTIALGIARVVSGTLLPKSSTSFLTLTIAGRTCCPRGWPTSTFGMSGATQHFQGSTS
jgi:hypothetical protein